MKFYEKEVLSIPAGKSHKLVDEFNIYACPDTKYYNYKKSIFVGFRKSKGGVMERLYKIEEIIILNPTNESELETFKNSTYSDKVKIRVSDYIRTEDFGKQLEYDMRFYVLSESEKIELPHQPKPERNNAKFTYYTLTEVLTNKIIVPESKIVNG